MPHVTSKLLICGVAEPRHPGPLHPHWAETARAKGFTLVARVRDRYSLALRCHTCDQLVCKKLYSLMSHQPDCDHCIETARRAEAWAAGLTFLRRDPGNRHYGHYRAPCGHEIRRQFELIGRVARGETGTRCETCQATREREEAAARGWELIGPDPREDTNYRNYRHLQCGAAARIARVNMQTGRFGCPGCGESWATAPSHLYAMRFELKPGRFVVKLGFSRDPASRLNYQLPRMRGLPRTLLCSVPIDSGQHALTIEKRLHRRLQAAHPGGLVPPEDFVGHLKVKSEIYRPEMERPILKELHRVARKQAKARAQAKAIAKAQRRKDPAASSESGRRGHG